MNYQSLYYFVEAAKDLNFTQTSRRLFITQQALSDQIRKLERYYDTSFFTRRPKLRLTFQGEQMLSFARQIIQAERALIDSLHVEEEKKHVKLTIASVSSRGEMMPAILERYLAMYPNVIPSIYTGSADTLITRLQMEGLDVYFGSYRQTHGEYTAEALTKDELFFLIRRELLENVLADDADAFLRSGCRGITLADTARFPVTLAPVSAAARTFMEIAFRSHGVAPNVTIETDSNETMFDISASGLCGAFVMREVVYNRLRRNAFPRNLLCFPLLDLEGLSSYGIAYQKSILPDYISDFILCCKNVLMEAEQTVDRFTAKQFAEIEQRSPRGAEKEDT